jgi:hypothetical protein
MTQKHPITPSPELVKQWVDTYFGGKISQSNFHVDLATRAAQWGADQELEACCAIALVDPVCGTKHQRSMLVRHIRERRRPKPPSLKEQALLALSHLLDGAAHSMDTTEPADYIRRALEQLPE